MVYNTCFAPVGMPPDKYRAHYQPFAITIRAGCLLYFVPADFLCEMPPAVALRTSDRREVKQLFSAYPVGFNFKCPFFFAHNFPFFF